MALLLLFPVLMIGTVIAVALSADSFQAPRENESDVHPCCGAQKYASNNDFNSSKIIESELIAA